MSKRKPQDLWKQLVDEAGEDEIERAANVSVEQAEAELRAAGFDVAAERAKAEAFLDVLDGGPAAAMESAARDAAVARDRARERKRPRPVVLWIATAATVAVAGGAIYAALGHPAPPSPPLPPPTPSTPAPAPTTLPDLVAAANLRQQAAGDCDAKQWSTCLAHLDQARAADPDGDGAPAVKTLRDRAIKGILAEDKPR
jgi:hypothetical protein